MNWDLLTKIRAAAKPAPKSRFQRPNSQDPRAVGTTRSTPSTNNSSTTKGIAKASANGHPTIAPVAKRSVDNKVRRPFSALGGARENANANVLAYIANVEGRKAINVVNKGIQREWVWNIPAEAFHIPALVKSMKNKYLPTRSFTFSTTFRCNFASHKVDARARVIRTAKNAGL